jgi:geranylgeranyl diphosphate synthase type II
MSGNRIYQTDINAYLKEKRELVDSFFRSYYQEGLKPLVLQKAMLYSLFAGGKRIRPILALTSYEACGGDSHEIVPYAAALELIHTYSLIHDDLPAMDNDDLRRGKPTNHKVFGEAVAILAGDAMLTEAFGILSDNSLCNSVAAVDLLRVLNDVSRSAGVRGMVAGQVQDILSENSEPDVENLEFIHRHKTAALIRSSVTMGPMLYGCYDSRLEALASYGNSLGLAFQVIDDILDVEGSTEELGKTVGSDERIHKLTYPSLFGVVKSREIAEQLIAEAVSSLEGFSSAADPLREIAFYLLKRRS